MSKYKNNKGFRQEWIAQRRQIMLEIINADPNKRWSARKLEREMKNHPIVQKYQPGIGKSTIHLDWVAVMGEINDKIKDLATTYKESQLELADELLTDLMEEYELLNSIDVDEIIDPDVRAQTIISRVKMKKELVASIDRLMARQSEILPVRIPKQINVQQAHVTMTLDRFLEMREKALELPEITKELEEANWEEIEE